MERIEAYPAGDDDVWHVARSLEALLFMSGEALTMDDLCELTGREPQQINAALDVLRQEYERRALWIANVAGGFRLATRPEYGELVAKLLQPRRFRLSRAALETLAIIAYRQPVTRPEMEDIRGVNVDGVVDTLLQYELVRECGRRHSPGRPIQYATTENFLTHFGLNSVQDLPDLDQIGPRAGPEMQQHDGAEGDDARAPETQAAEPQPGEAQGCD